MLKIALSQLWVKAVSTKHNATLGTDVGLVIETVYCCEHCSEPKLTVPLAWVQGFTTITRLSVLSWLQGSAMGWLCTESPGTLLVYPAYSAGLRSCCCRSAQLHLPLGYVPKNGQEREICWTLFGFIANAFWRFYRQFSLSLWWTVVKDVSMTHWMYVDIWPSSIVMQRSLISTLAVLPCFTIWLVRDF